MYAIIQQGMRGVRESINASSRRLINHRKMSQQSSDIGKIL